MTTMTTTALNGKAFDGLIRKLREHHGPVTPTQLSLIDQFVWSFLVWEASLAEAERALRKIQSNVVDYNELRVCLPEETVGIIGPRYPRAQERAMRLRAGLQDIYLREHIVSLDHLADAPKRTARQYLDTLDGVPAFVAGRVFLLGLGGHALPLDERLVEKLKEYQMLEEDTTVERAIAALERHVKAEDAPETHLLLVAWASDENGGPRIPRPKPDAKAGKPSKSKPRKD